MSHDGRECEQIKLNFCDLEFVSGSFRVKERKINRKLNK